MALAFSASVYSEQRSSQLIFGCMINVSNNDAAIRYCRNEKVICYCYTCTKFYKLIGYNYLLLKRVIC